MSTSSLPETSEAASASKPSREPAGALVAVLVLVPALVLTAAWIYALVALAGWILSAIF